YEPILAQAVEGVPAGFVRLAGIGIARGRIRRNVFDACCLQRYVVFRIGTIAARKNDYSEGGAEQELKDSIEIHMAVWIVAVVFGSKGPFEADIKQPPRHRGNQRRADDVEGVFDADLEGYPLSIRDSPSLRQRGVPDGVSRNTLVATVRHAVAVEVAVAVAT